MNVVKFSYFLVFFAYILDYLELEIPSGPIKQGIVLVLFLSLIYSFRNKFSKSLLPNPVTITFLFTFNFLGLLTAFFADDILTSIITLIGLNIYFAIYYLNSFRLSLSKELLIGFNNIVIGTSVMMCFIALFANPTLTISQFYTYYYGRTRIYGLFQEPNLIAAVCFVVLVACFINHFLTDSKRHKIYYRLVFLGVLYLLILSDSRGGLYSFAIFIVMHLFMKLTKKFSYTTKILLTCLFATVTIVTLPSAINIINQRFSTSFKSYNELTSGRLGNWEIIFGNLQTDKLRYFLGYGLSSGDSGPLFQLGMTSDNGYLIWLFQAGIISLILLVLLLVNVLRVNIKNNELNVITIPLFVCYLFYATFENFLMSFGHIIPFYCWTIIFIAFHVKNNYISKESIDINSEDQIQENKKIS